MSKNYSVNETTSLTSAERGFTFPLPMQVEGINARGQDFSEGTILTYINHQGSSFYLKNPVHIGTRLRLVIDLPEKLSEDKNLKLVISLGRIDDYLIVSMANDNQHLAPATAGGLLLHIRILPEILGFTSGMTFRVRPPTGTKKWHEPNR